jgi:hypothetical protein
MAHPTGELESGVVRLEVLWSVEKREYLRQFGVIRGNPGWRCDLEIQGLPVGGS